MYPSYLKHLGLCSARVEDLGANHVLVPMYQWRAFVRALLRVAAVRKAQGRTHWCPHLYQG